MASHPKSIDIIVIGLNSEKTLAACFSSITSSSYPQNLITVYYVDGGSKDASIRIAEKSGAHVLSIKHERPTPGRQRNKGWETGTSEIVQFLDSDTILAPDWLGKGSSALASDVGAVLGDVSEKYPERTKYNWIGDLEWNPPLGEIEVFGGIVMTSRKALEKTEGYNSELIAGEDPELAYRIRKEGYRIIKLDSQMVYHDLNMTTFRQYWKRSLRSGHAFAEIHELHKDFWAKEVRRITIRAGSFFFGLLLFPISIIHPFFLVCPIFGALSLIRPRLFKVRNIEKEKGLSKKAARLYAWHLSIVVIPQYLGVLRYKLGRLLSKPMTNRKLILP